MKRNYFKAAMLTALTSVAVAFGISAATSEGWHKPGKEPAPLNLKAPVSEVTKYLRSRGHYGANGQLTPVFEGVAATPKISQKPAGVMRSPSNPRGHIYAVVNRHTGMEYTYQAYLGSLDLKSGYITPLYYGSEYCPYISNDYVFQTNCYRKGQIMCPAYKSDLDSFEYYWDVVDLATGDLVDHISFGGDVFGCPYALTYDCDKDLFYGCSIGNETDSQFCVIDPNNNFELDYIKWLGTNNNFIAALAYNSKDKKLYGFNQDNMVYTIEPDTGEMFEAGVLDCDYMPFEIGIAGQMVYSPMDEMFITIYRDADVRKSRILYIDPETFEVYEGGFASSLTEPYVASLICSDEYASADAPELAPEPTVSFDKASLSGTITFTTPTDTYYGVQIGSTPLKVKATIDGNVVYEGTLAAGASHTLDLTLAEGEHVFELTTAIGDEVSPVRSVTFYTGHDNPVAPANIRLDIDRLTWDAPSALGVHKGYVDTEALEYNVYVNGLQQNANPIEGTSFTLRLPANVNLAKIEVEADCWGKLSKRASIQSVIGKPLSLPVTFAPTQAESDLFTVYNVNDDPRRWFWDVPEGETNPAMAFVVGYFEDADDWFILPAMNFDSAEKLYNFAFKMASVWTEGSDESFEVFLAKKPTVEAMKKGICVTHREHNFVNTLWKPMSFDFAVTEPGAYYLGFHCISSKNNDAWGMCVRDLTIAEVDGKTSAIPADPTKVEITTGDLGALYADFKVTLPTLDIAGKPLPADQDVTVTVANDYDSRSAKGKPGQTIDISCDVDADGYCDFEITPSNEIGDGYTRVHRAYVGIDRPFCPTNIKGVPTADNLKLYLSWDAPKGVGVNGGYVDVDNLKYNIYTRSGIAYYKVGSTTALSALFDPNIDTQNAWHVGPAAENEAGESTDSNFVQDVLGKPYEVPMIEEWNSSAFTYGPYTFMTIGEYEGSHWENISYGEGLGIGDAKLIQGGICGYSESGRPVEAKVMFSKLTTLGVMKANFILRYWDYADCPDINVYGRRAGHEDEELLYTFHPSKDVKGRWNDAYFALPAGYLNCSWVQFRVGAHLSGKDTEYMLFDSYQVFPDADYDLKLMSVEGPTMVSVGETPSFLVKVSNAGNERLGGTLITELLDENGNLLAEDQANVPSMTSNQVFERNVKFEIDGSMIDISKATVHAMIDCTPDENINNNERTLQIDIMASQIPAVNDLAGEIAEDGSVNLSWSTPVSSYGGFDNYEFYPAFNNAETIGMWKNVDLDELPVAVFEYGALKIDWEGAMKPHGWVVIDTDELGISSDERCKARSGHQYLMARCAYLPDDVEDVTSYQSSDWLISPEVKGGTQVSFWMNTLSTETEYLEIWYSTSGTELAKDANLASGYCGDFRKLKPISKGGTQTWELISFTLPANAKYFAIRHCGFDGYAVMIDDISFTPAEMMSRDIEHYTLFRSDNGGDFKMVGDKISGNSHKDATFADSKAYYYVVANSMVDGRLTAGPKSNKLYIAGSKVENVDIATAVTGGYGEIVFSGLEGEKADIFTADGKKVLTANIRTQRSSYALAAGIYMVQLSDGRSLKVMVK